MAWEEIEPEEEDTFQMYPKFEKVGDFVEGNLYEFDKDGFNNKRMVIDVGEDEELLLQYLPTHTNLRRFYNKVNIGDFLHVELVKLIPPKEDQEYPTRIYKVKIDRDRKVTYNTEDEDEDDDEYFEQDIGF